MTDYLQKILRARVYDVARETPLDPAPNLSRRLNNTVWLKREDLQPVFSFKLRGAYNRMAQLSDDELERDAAERARAFAAAVARVDAREERVALRDLPARRVAESKDARGVDAQPRSVREHICVGGARVVDELRERRHLQEVRDL